MESPISHGDGPGAPPGRLGARWRQWWTSWVALLAIGTALRVALLAQDATATPAAVLPALLLRGAFLDGLVATCVLAPLGLALAARRAVSCSRGASRAVGATLFFGAVVFGAFVEFFFFEEFNARFNHIALDYLLFPGEVAGNVWESYPVPVYVASALALGGALAWWVCRSTSRARSSELAGAARARAWAWAIGAPFAALAVLSVLPRWNSGDRRRDEIAANGWVQLVRAFRSASLDFESYYHSVPEPRARELAQPLLGRPVDPSGQHEFTAFERRETPLDVVVILEESFGSEFVGRLGGRNACASGFERWAERGTLLTNLMATGNRTVRGLEGVLCSFVPLPGDSIWKRPESTGQASLASVLAQRGYRTEFVYGGDGDFDRMRRFALANGWQSFLDDQHVGASAFPSDAFRTIWGVADEFTFDVLLGRQREAARDGVRFFGTALSVSNHKPYLTPDTQGARVRTERLAKTLPLGAGLLVASVLAWGKGRARLGRTRLALMTGFCWLVVGALTWSNIQPRDTRQNAVRYADRALAEYLDRASAEGLLDHTAVLIVGDHGARVYGAEEIPAASYRVPGLLLAPEERYHGRTLDALCSQIDLAPTLLSLAGVDFRAPFFGSDLLAASAGAPGRAFLIHNRDIGLLTETELCVLGLNGTLARYVRSDRASDAFQRLPPSPDDRACADRACSAFALASELYESGHYRLESAP